MERSGNNRGRQPLLFRLDNPLTAHFGSRFFAGLPAGPGVYFYYDDAGRLLYIGQSASLKARIGSYRHVTPERHPRRSLRLVARVRRIEWELCATAADAIERERVLLLEHRPPFNRAGVWSGPAWWLSFEILPGILRLNLGRDENGLGPLPSSFRHAFGALVRCIYRCAFPDHGLHTFPHGLTRLIVPHDLSLALPDPGSSWQIFAESAAGDATRLLEMLDALPPAGSEIMAEYWKGERDRVETFARTKRIRDARSSSR
jgi:hypothetical protein